MLGDCYKGNPSVKKTFSWVGFSKPSQLNKPIKDMNKEEEFSCVMHKMPKREAVTIRFEAWGHTYQVKIGHNGQRLYVNKPTWMITANDPTLYDWQGEETYHTLTADKIRNSVQRADQMNRQKEQEEGQELIKTFISLD